MGIPKEVKALIERFDAQIDTYKSGKYFRQYQ